MSDIIFGTIPDFTIIDQFERDTVRPVRWVDIYESDNETLWRERVAITDGRVSVDMNREERRNLDLTLSDKDGDLGYGPGAFWYDKILKPYRGIVLDNGDAWVTCLGEFIPDKISRPHFPSTIGVTARDFMKQLLGVKFAQTTLFEAGENVGEVVQTIAVNGGITKLNFATTTAVLMADTAFERGTPRGKACLDLAKGIGFELFFDAYGYLTFRPYVDPLTAPVTYTFRTGGDGNLAAFELVTTDTLLKNDVIVYGDSQSNPLVFGRATNTNPTSPTNVAKLGYRTYEFPSQFVADDVAAQEIADALLAVQGLEQYDMRLTSIVVPWLEAGDAVETLVPNAAPGDPTRFLLTNFDIPLGLAPMDGTAKRVTIVG